MVMEEELYPKVLLDEGGARQVLAGRLFSVPVARSILSLPDPHKRALTHVVLQRLPFLRQASSSSPQRNLYFYHTPNPVPNVTPLGELRPVEDPGEQDMLTAHPWTGASPSTGQPTYLPDHASPSSAYCANVEVQLQIKPGMWAVFTYRRVYAVMERRVDARMTGLQWQGGGRGNVRLELGSEHGAGGARRLFKLCGFSPALNSMNATWRSDSVSADGKQVPWVALNVTGPAARGITQQLVEAEDGLLRTARSQPRIESVFDLAEGSGSLSLLAFQKVVGSGGTELGTEELLQVLEEIGMQPAPPEQQAPGSPPAPAPNLPTAPAAQSGSLEAGLQMQWLQLDAMSSQQEHTARRVDINTDLHAKSHIRLSRLEMQGQKHAATLTQHTQLLQSHGEKLSELADVCKRRQLREEGQNGQQQQPQQGRHAQQPQHSQQGQQVSGQMDSGRRSVKRRLEDGSAALAAGIVGEGGGMAAQHSGKGDGQDVSMEHDVLTNGWIDIDTMVSSQPQPQPMLAAGTEPFIAQHAAHAAHLQPPPPPSPLILLQSPEDHGGALAAPAAAAPHSDLHLALPQEHMMAVCETAVLLQQLGVVEGSPPADYVPDRAAVAAFLVGGDCLKPMQPLTTQQVIADVQRRFRVTSALGCMQVSTMVGELLLELCQCGRATPGTVEGASPLGPRFAWCMAMPQQGS